MKRVLMVLGVTGAMLFAAAPAGCDTGQLMRVLGAMCPECYAHYLALHPGANQ